MPQYGKIGAKSLIGLLGISIVKAIHNELIRYRSISSWSFLCFFWFEGYCDLIN